MRSVIADMLHGSGFHVLQATDGADALDLMIDEPVDLVVTDLLMPGVGGLELADELRTRAPETPVVFVSSTADLDDRSPRVGGARVLRKPLRRAELLATVTAALADHGSKR